MENNSPKEPKFNTMDKVLLPMIGILIGFVFWAGTHPSEFIDFTLKLDKEWKGILTFLLK